MELRPATIPGPLILVDYCGQRIMRGIDFIEINMVKKKERKRERERERERKRRTSSR